MSVSNSALRVLCLCTGWAADWFLSSQSGASESGRSGAVEARLWISHHHFGTPRLCGAQGTGVYLETRSNSCSHSSGHYSKHDTYTVYYCILYSLHHLSPKNVGKCWKKSPSQSPGASGDVLVFCFALFVLTNIPKPKHIQFTVELANCHISEAWTRDCSACLATLAAWL